MYAIGSIPKESSMYIVKDAKGHKKYALLNFKDTCWQVHKWRRASTAKVTRGKQQAGDKIAAGWVPKESYHGYVHDGLKRIYDLMILEDCEFNERELKSAIAAMKAIAEDVKHCKKE